MCACVIQEGRSFEIVYLCYLCIMCVRMLGCHVYVYVSFVRMLCLRHSALYKAVIDHTICCVLCCARIIIFLISCVLLSP